MVKAIKYVKYEVIDGTTNKIIRKTTDMIPANFTTEQIVRELNKKLNAYELNMLKAHIVITEITEPEEYEIDINKVNAIYNELRNIVKEVDDND